MKRFMCILLVLVLTGFILSGCDRRSAAPEDAADGYEGNFAPETTVMGGLTQAVEDQNVTGAEDEMPVEEDMPSTEALFEGMQAIEDIPQEDANAQDPADENAGDAQDAVEDQPLDSDAETNGSDDSDTDTTPDPDMPFPTATPQPNTAVSEYSEVSAPGLGFRFSYPSNWVNIPGRSTVCYVQPLEDGTVYPARVAVTMKRMPHTSDYEEAQTELANYLRTLMTQYDSSTFKVNTKLNYKTEFMGKPAISTTYLAYDGNQEIKGYTIITYFERYLYVFHFLCAYDDYTAFGTAMKYMRDSVQADASVAPR